MGAIDEYSGQSQRVGHLERDRAEKFLQEAYAQGRIDEDEFESRIDRALNARTRADLNSTFNDLVPVSAAYFGPHPVYRPQPERGSAQVPGTRTAAGLAHLLPFVSWILGPALVYAMSSPGSYARREAAKAFNWTLISSMLFFVVLLLVGPGPLPGFVATIAFFAWIAVSVVGAVKAFNGENWSYPMMCTIPWKPLSEK